MVRRSLPNSGLVQNQALHSPMNTINKHSARERFRFEGEQVSWAWLDMRPAVSMGML